MSSRRDKAQDPNQLLLFPSEPVPSVDPASNHPRFDQVMSEIAASRKTFASKEEYYLSPEWRAKRQLKLEKVGYKCERCGSSGRLDVHHLDYRSLYDERMEDLEVVCRSCHGPADARRERDSAFYSFMQTKYGDYAVCCDPSDHADEFDDWYDRVTDSDW